MDQLAITIGLVVAAGLGLWGWVELVVWFVKNYVV